ncbi:MAG: HDOD domain-containing protein [Phycisphaerales bacterium JB050]
MSELTAQKQIVTDAIKEISHIATLPEITVKIIELVEDPTSTAQDLNNIISNDPALCSRILKVVNSSFYGLPGQIGSINRAIVLLGLNAVKNIAISASMAKLFRGGQLCDKFSARDLWMHAIATAAASKLIADKLKMGVGDEAFLAGLTHDIGMMVEMQFDRAKLIEVIDQINVNADGVPDRDMREVEREVFGADHQAFGKALCERWKFPEAFAQVTGHHHNPLDLPTGARSMACLVHVADHLASTLDHAFRLDHPSVDIDGSILDEINLSRDALEDVRSQLADEVDEVAAMLA